jgi:sugar transferase (PEP-CTERM/EpsH1 system associated)
MKILVVTTRIPYPLNEGANMRIFNLLKALATRHEVSLATLLTSKSEEVYLGRFEPFCRRVGFVMKERTRARRLWDIATSAVVSVPYLSYITRSEKMNRLVTEMSREVDIVQAEFPYAAQYILNTEAFKVLDAHNVEADILRGRSNQQTTFGLWLYHHLQQKRMEKAERDLCSRMDLILTTSEDDRRQLMKFNSWTEVVPNAIDHLPQDTWDRDNKRITFTGLMRYTANVDGARWFCEEIWPLVRQKEPDAEFFIVGKSPVPAVRRLQGNGVHVTGEVESVSDYLLDTSVVVAPLRIGSGTRIKILEAMAHGKPVVSTRLGCMGLDIEDGRNICIADNAREFADLVVSLLGSSEERERIGAEGRRVVEKQYTWRAVAESLANIYDNAKRQQSSMPTK